MRIAVAQIGARRHYAVPASLARSGLLETLFTDIRSKASWRTRCTWLLSSSFRPGNVQRFLDRVVPDVPDGKIQCFPLFALGRALSRWMRITSADLYGAYVSANQRFGRLVARRGFGSADTVYAFNGAAVEIFERARELGARRILDQTMAPIAYVESLLEEERCRWPGWDEGAAGWTNWRALAERESAEWELADLILCGSRFVAESIGDQAGPIDHCRVVPFGYRGQTTSAATRKQSNGLNVLFVGSVDLRKGVPYLLDAARRVAPSTRIRIRAVGPIRAARSAVRQFGHLVELVGVVPRSEIPLQYRWADVLVLPTLAEGSANVCYEAMAHGVPVITTPNAGSMVQDGYNGFIVPIRSGEAIAEKMERLASDRALHREFSRSAFERAREFSAEQYEGRLVTTIQSFFDAESARSAA